MSGPVDSLEDVIGDAIYEVSKSFGLPIVLSVEDRDRVADAVRDWFAALAAEVDA